MAVKNIHTTIASEKTISEIIKILTKFGARKILQDIDKGGRIIGISFIIELEDGRNVPFKLPMRVEKARAVIERAVQERILPKKFRNEPDRTDRAMMVGWRIIKDSIHSQLSLFEMNYSDAVEIFLAYAYHIKTNKTLYEKMLDGKLKTLAIGHEEA